MEHQSPNHETTPLAEAVLATLREIDRAAASHQALAAGPWALTALWADSAVSLRTILAGQTLRTTGTIAAPRDAAPDR